MKACSFFGHRNTPQTEELHCKVKEFAEKLIIEQGADTFLFGSRSRFDELCYQAVTELKEKYPHIRRISYLCKSETACLAGKGAEMRESIQQLTGRDVFVPEYEEIKYSDRVNAAGKAAYVERNEWMIDESEFVGVYYDEKQAKPSGTRLAYEYALKKKRKVENFR